MGRSPVLTLTKIDLQKKKKEKKKMAHNKGNTYLSEERLTTLIREIFREELEKQQENLLNLISGNLEITMKAITSIKTEVNDLKNSIEFTENVLEEKFKSALRKLNTLMNEFGKYMNGSWILNMSITN